MTAADWARASGWAWTCASRWEALTASAEGMRFLVTIVSQLPDWDERIKVVAKVGSAKIRGFRREAEVHPALRRGDPALLVAAMRRRPGVERSAADPW